MKEFALRKLPGMTLTVTVKTTKEFHLRIAIAKALFWIAMRVLGGRINFEEA